MQKLMKLKNKKGFTLIEMLVVILIIVILITIAVPAVAGYRRDAQETADSGAAKTVFTALEAAATKESPALLDTGTVDGVSDAVYTIGTNGLTTVTDTDTAVGGEYGEDVLAFLGANFKGRFKFGYDQGTHSINWVSYCREGVTDNDAVMLFHAQEGYTGYLEDYTGTKTNYELFATP